MNQLMGFGGYRVTGLRGYQVTRLRVTRLPGYGLQGLQGLQGARISFTLIIENSRNRRIRNSRILEKLIKSEILYFSGFQGLNHITKNSVTKIEIQNIETIEIRGLKARSVTAQGFAALHPVRSETL